MREVGPLFVMWYDDGSVWARGMPPLHPLVQLDTFAGALRRKGFARLCARIDACLSAAAVDALSRELERARARAPRRGIRTACARHCLGG